MKLKEKRESLKKELEKSCEIVKGYFKEQLENYHFTISDERELLNKGSIDIVMIFSNVVCENDEVSNAYKRICELVPEKELQSTIEDMWLEVAIEIFEDCSITVSSENDSNWVVRLDIDVED